MLIAYPEMFAAAYPICEALGDQYVTDEDIDRIKKIPIWFTHAANDSIVLISTQWQLINDWFRREPLRYTSPAINLLRTIQESTIIQTIPPMNIMGILAGFRH